MPKIAWSTTAHACSSSARAIHLGPHAPCAQPLRHAAHPSGLTQQGRRTWAGALQRHGGPVGPVLDRVVQNPYDPSMARPRSFDDDDVLSRALDTFWTYGYAGTSPAKLADAMGLSKGSLYNAFSSKRKLFDQCLKLYHEQNTNLAKKLLWRPGTAKSCIHDTLRAVIDSELAQPHRRGCFMIKTATEMAGQDAEIAGTVQRMHDDQVDWFTERIEKGKSDGDLKDDIDARACGEYLESTLSGLRVTALTQSAPALHRIIQTALIAL